MARPAKSVKTQTRHNTKKDIQLREETENRLKGNSRLEPPSYLTESQRDIFEYIKSVFDSEGADILGQLDVYILSQTAIAIDRLKSIDEIINFDSGLIIDKDTVSARKAYTQEFFRCCNELCLSPQARAKIGSLNLQKSKENSDPLLQILKRADSS